MTRSSPASVCNIASGVREHSTHGGAPDLWSDKRSSHPREVLGRLRSVIKPGGRLVSHEYFDYSTWRFTPRSPEFEQFVTTVMKSWRASGGEPDIGLDLPRWLEELGFEVRELRTIVDVITPDDMLLQWPRTS